MRIGVIMSSIFLQAITSSLATKGGLSAGDVATQHKFKNGSLDVKLDTESNVQLILFLVLNVSCILSCSWQWFIDWTDPNNHQHHRFSFIHKSHCFFKVAWLQLWQGTELPLVNNRTCITLNCHVTAVYSFCNSWRYSIYINMLVSLQLLAWTSLLLSIFRQLLALPPLPLVQRQLMLQLLVNLQNIMLEWVTQSQIPMLQ